MSALPTISTEALAERLTIPTPFQLWNVLNDDYFNGTFLPGSLRLPSDNVGRIVAALGLAKHAEIVVYCAGEHCPSSRSAAEKLIALGYTNVRAYEGGLEAWANAGHPIVRIEQGPIAAAA